MIEQGTEEWFAQRLGKATASRMSDILAAVKSGEAASRRNYRTQLLAERLTGQTHEDGFQSYAMERGKEVEEEARSAYAFYVEESVQLAEFVDHPGIAMAGASPDSLVGNYGIVEIKCPNTATHLGYLAADKVPTKYLPQMRWQLACRPERLWNDFVSYDPRLPEEIAFFTKRLERVDAEIATLETAVELFLKEVDEAVQKLCAQHNIRERLGK